MSTATSCNGQTFCQQLIAIRTNTNCVYTRVIHKYVHKRGKKWIVKFGVAKKNNISHKYYSQLEMDGMRSTNKRIYEKVRYTRDNISKYLTESDSPLDNPNQNSKPGARSIQYIACTKYIVTADELGGGHGLQAEKLLWRPEISHKALKN